MSPSPDPDEGGSTEPLHARHAPRWRTEGETNAVGAPPPTTAAQGLAEGPANAVSWNKEIRDTQTETEDETLYLPKHNLIIYVETPMKSTKSYQKE